MNTESVTIFEPDRKLPEIDLTPVKIPPRSQLISLAPLGVDNGDIESMWSYLNRLGEAHAVRLFDLISTVFGQFMVEIFGRRWKSDRAGDWKHVIMSASGATFGLRVAALVEKLNGQSGLAALTLAPVAKIAGLNVSLREGQAWCSCCLKDASVPYEHLYWAVAGVTRCYHHGRLLDRLCPTCGKEQKLFSTKSDIVRCIHCGASKADEVKGVAATNPELEEFGQWYSGQIRMLLKGAGIGALETRHLDVRAHNLRTMCLLPEIKGITGLAAQMGLGRSTAWSWLNHGRSMPIESAIRWAWLAGVDLPRLFSEKLAASDFHYRPLPAAILSRNRTVRRAPVRGDTTTLYLSALRLSAGNPFMAPRLDALVSSSGVHPKHPAFQDIHFRKLINRLREHERLFRRKERVWREISEVHEAAVKVAMRGARLSRARVGKEMEKPGCFGGPLARSYLGWIKQRISAGDLSVLDPKRVPLDVRAFWSLAKAQKTTKGG